MPLKEQGQPKKLDLAKYFNLRAGDLVQVLHGRSQGKTGVVLQINSKKNTVVVEGCNVKRCFWNPRRGPGEPSILSKELPIHVTNIALLDPVTKKPTRVKRRYSMNGECVRISKLSGCAMPSPPSVETLREKDWFQVFLSDKATGPLIKPEYAEKDPHHFKVLQRLSNFYRSRSAARDSPHQPAQ